MLGTGRAEGRAESEGRCDEAVVVDERKREGGEERIAGSEARIIVIGSLVVPSQLAVVGIRRLDTVGFGASCQLPP